MIKKLITISATAGLIALSALPALAAGRVSVSNTGQGSVVDARVNRVKSQLMTVLNSYTLNHDVLSDQNTGDNTADNNTGEGLAAAGNVVQTDVTSQVEANSSNVDIDVSDNETCNCVDNITVDMTGQDSNVTAEIDSSKSVTVTFNNTGSVNNTFSSTVNTGGNSANNNTGNGTALGGEVSVKQMITTKINSVWAKIKM